MRLRILRWVGFKEVKRIKWDDNYAPPNRDYEKNGRPDVVFMKLNQAIKIIKSLRLTGGSSLGSPKDSIYSH